MADFLRKLDLAPTNADHVPPSGLASAAEFGDHIARKSRSELFWHHGIFKSKGQALGTYLVVDSFPHEGQPSVQTRTLEEFLGDDADDALLCLAKLADHLGLSSLLETAAEALIKLPWEKNMLYLNHLLQVPLYERDTDRRDKLLHHPKRGAYTELQLLELLRAANTPWSNCASAIDLESLQPSELHVLLGSFAERKWDSDFEALLRPALKEQLMPEALRSKLDWTKPVRFTHGIMLPEQGTADDNGNGQYIILQKCDLKLQITHRHREGQEVDGLYLHPNTNPQKTLEDMLHQFTLFSMHTRTPYLRSCMTASHAQFRSAAAGFGWPDFFGEVRKHYPRNYSGPFTVGVSWQDASDAVSK